MAKKKLNKVGREDVALALIFLKDFKCDGKFDTTVLRQTMELADYLGVRSEYDRLSTRIPMMKIEERK